MTGDEAAAIVEQLCLQKIHARSHSPGAAPTVCAHCIVVINRLRAKHQDDQPPLPITSVHFVIHPDGDKPPLAVMDEIEANRKASEVKGVVVSMPVSSDWREVKTDE